MSNEVKQKSILIIEDDTFLATIYKNKFEAEGFRVYTETNGEAGLDTFLKKIPSLVLLDVLLPKMDGFTILQKAKQSKKIMHVPIILLTNLGHTDDVKKGMELGAIDYLIKAHFKPSETVKKVKNILNT